MPVPAAENVSGSGENRPRGDGPRKGAPRKAQRSHQKGLPVERGQGSEKSAEDRPEQGRGSTQPSGEHPAGKKVARKFAGKKFAGKKVPGQKFAGKKYAGKRPTAGKTTARPKGGPPSAAKMRAAEKRLEAKRKFGAYIGVQRLNRDEYMLELPECALDRQEDIDEVHNMIQGQELEIARDELLYLVSDCRGFLAAHNLLGELALEENDISLARGHFGFAYELVLESLPEGFRGRLPLKAGPNRQFYAAGRGLARCLIAEGKLAEGREVLQRLLQLDPQQRDAKSLLKELDEREQGVPPVLYELSLPGTPPGPAAQQEVEFDDDEDEDDED